MQQNIESLARLILSGERENVELAAAQSVGLNCRRAAWQRAVEIDKAERFTSQ